MNWNENKEDMKRTELRLNLTESKKRDKIHTNCSKQRDNWIVKQNWVELNQIRDERRDKQTEFGWIKDEKRLGCSKLNWFKTWEQKWTKPSWFESKTSKEIK